jgi:hypothetical protein
MVSMPPRPLPVLILPILILGLNAASPASPQNPPARLTGTFLQLDARHREWSEPQWSELFDRFRKLELSQVIVQWTVFDETAFYAGGTGVSPVERILAIAQREEMSVWLGLCHDSRYWRWVGGEPKAAGRHLARLRSRSLAAARDLATLAKASPAFAGWYLSEEIDDVNWRNTEARRKLLDHLKLETAGLKDLTPGARVAISGFTNARVSPNRFRTFWKDVFEASTIDLVLLQDGIGVRKLELPEFPLYAAALAEAAKRAGRECGTVVELFRQTGGEPLDSGPFRASPAPFLRVRRQLEIAARFPGPVFGFSVPEYMSPAGVEGAGQLHSDYVREILGAR